MSDNPEGPQPIPPEYVITLTLTVASIQEGLDFVAGLSRQIHDHASRADYPTVALNTSSLVPAGDY